MKLAQSSDQATATVTIKEKDNLKKYSVKATKKTSSSESAASLSTEQKRKKSLLINSKAKA